MDRASTKKKKPRKTSEEHQGEDRISGLPDDVIHLILKFVDNTRLAVQTSAISKRWKFIWTTLPFLKFEFECSNFSRSSKHSTDLARHVLKNRNNQSRISFLEISYFPPVLADKFIDYAVSHQVQDLNIYFRREHKPIKLSRFSSNSISNLVLRMRVKDIVEDSDFWDLPALTNLFLWLLPTGGDDIDVLPVRCLTCLPALRTLTLMLWDFREPPLYLSLPELTTLNINMSKMPQKIWNLPALKTLTLYDVDFSGNMSEMFAALENLENLTLHRMCMQDCYIRCPRLRNLEIETRYFDVIEDNIVVLAPKLMNFTSIGIFPITFEDSKLENVYLKIRGWINRENIPRKRLKLYYQQFIFMLPGLGSAKILNLQLETIEALSSISDSLASCPSPFYNLEYVKLPHGVEEASLSSILRSYLLGGSPTATIVAKLPQINIIPHTAAASVTGQNMVIEETLAAPTFLDSEYLQNTVCVDSVDVEMQEELVVQNSKEHADGVIHVGAAVEGGCNDQVSSSRLYYEKLNMLCTVVNDFIKIPMTEVDTGMIVEYMDVFADLEKLGFDISWLVNRLNYVEQIRFSPPLLPKLRATDGAKSTLQDLQIRIDEAKTKLQDLQNLRSEKMQEIQKAFGNINTNLAVGCVGDDLLSGP
ncbi:hypothetical protein OROHE_026084 [Orobanche hederae]